MIVRFKLFNPLCFQSIKILDFNGLKYPQLALVCQPKGYGLSLIKYAEQSILNSCVTHQTNQEMVAESVSQQHFSGVIH